MEVRDPEAAYEFAGLGVATVFYPGYLRAALLAHACVDLGVFHRGDLGVWVARPRHIKRAIVMHVGENQQPVLVTGMQDELSSEHGA